MKKLILFVSLLLSTTTAFAAPPSIMPDGLENVHLGMRVTELIEIRKNIKSGTTFDYCTSEGPIYCKWFQDPNNPKNLTPYRSRYQLKENYDFLFFDTAWFSFGPTLLHVTIDGGINTKKKRKAYAKNRDDFILYAVGKWGKPDLIAVGDENFTRGGKHDYYLIAMFWSKGREVVCVKFPLMVEEYFKSLTLSERFWNALRNIADNYPPVRVEITYRTAFDTSRHTHSGQIVAGKEAEKSLASYSPRQIVNKEESKKLLKSIGFDELLKQALAK